MIEEMRHNRVLWASSALLTLVAASIGILNPSIYSLVVTNEYLPGVLAQDLVSIIASITVLYLVAKIEANHTKRQMIIIGILGYFFYGYGIYVIERFYNPLYLIYMAVFGLSVYTILYNFVSIENGSVENIVVSRSIRNAAAVYLLINAIMFNIIWISQLLPLMQTGSKIEFLYSIYILDLCFIMPMFILMAILVLRNKGLALLTAPVLLVLGFLVLMPLALAEILKPLYFSLPLAFESIGLFLPLSVLFLIIGGLYLSRMKLESDSFPSGAIMNE
jgi:hypothetical protein